MAPRPLLNIFLKRYVDFFVNSFEFPILVNTFVNSQAPVVQKCYLLDISLSGGSERIFFLILIHLIIIYPVGSALRHF